MRRFFLLLTIAFLTTGLFAEPDNGKFLPERELIQPNHVFVEAGGALNFPMEFFSQGTIPMTSYGGSFFAVAGYNWQGWLLGLAYTHDMWGEGKTEKALMENFKTNIVEFRIRKIISKKMVSWFPGWLELIPGAGAGVNFITTDYYRSEQAKKDGRMTSVKLGQPGANCLFYRASLETAVFLGTDMFVPFIGIDYNAFYDTSIGGGFAGYARVYGGIRMYPLGVVNDVQRMIQNRQERKRLAYEEMIASWPEPFALITASPKEDFTPDEDGIADTATLSLTTDYLEYSPESWKVEILDPQNNEFKTWTGKGELPENLRWDGKSDSGELVFSRNTYTVRLTVIPDERDRERTQKEVLVSTDIITTGILMEVIIPNKKWKIIVNTIYFDADKATFNKISEEQRQENIETLDSIARQIKTHGNVNVTVEGYANNVSNTERENINELIPLSRLRAQTIVGLLTDRGLDKNLLSYEGKGGANPIAKWEDRKNWWKNRRVEFIVTKQE
ncbi:outer membrane protein OmpA-like peptidoglycan-associated protein [Treponema rectale]|uniref:Outer membrane protein OmpA-like peptidoglycan-associated protein n=1 Tax=Treponema rectale TaxID=744512 RepID=A0A840SKI3_9SPIR|nr:OmpA family protein [Treponema rectale]MBB5219973.1 outer membrane protein OmpA-like peptidoglycan-associated protein [Treponema rectale]